MIEAKTIPELFIRQLSHAGERVAIKFFRDRKLVSLTWNEIAHDVQVLAERIQAFELPVGSRAAHLSENRYEWIIADLAIQISGLVHVPVHQHLSAEQMDYQIKHSDAELLIVSPNLSPKLAEFHANRNQHISSTDFLKNRIITVNPMQSSLNRQTNEKLIERLKRHCVGQKDLLSIMYTSGTTGEPNGVMLTQSNIMANIFGKLDALSLYPDDVRLAFLPMTHIFSRTCDIYTWIAAGCTMFVSEGREHALKECASIRPTYINAVPFFYQRCFEIATGKRALEGKTSLRQLLGGKIRLCNCGGAPLADEVFEYFHANGVMLVTGYGLTETAPVLTSNRPGSLKKGTVGQALCNVDLRLNCDGELLTRGPNIFHGYWKDAEKTSEVFDDGWFCTGDLAEIDAEGFVTIIGRKKEMILTTGGFNIFPAPIEEKLKQSTLVDQCIVIGDRQNYLIALVVASNVFASEKKSDLTRKLMEDFKRILKSVSKYERIGKVLVVDEPFTIENGLLTPKMSLRRAEIEKRFEFQIAAAYSST